MFKEIRPDNVIMFAMKHYSNPYVHSEKDLLNALKKNEQKYK